MTKCKMNLSLQVLGSLPQDEKEMSHISNELILNIK